MVIHFLSTYVDNSLTNQVNIDIMMIELDPGGRDIMIDSTNLRQMANNIIELKKLIDALDARVAALETPDTPSEETVTKRSTSKK